MHVAVVGIWHLGIVTACGLADLGHEVVGIDADADALSRGEPPLFEPGIEESLRAHLASGRLRFTASPDGVREASHVIVAFDTPVDEHDAPDLTPVLDAVRAFAPHLAPGATVIVSSQVPVGTCARIAAMIDTVQPSQEIGAACVPENLRLGQAVDRFRHPDLLVVGAETAATIERVEALLAPIEAPRVHVNLATAEMIKHAINAFLATSISYANEIAQICEGVGADAVEVARALRLEPRIGPRAFVSPGLGFAGGTLARDLHVLRGLAKTLGVDAPLFSAVTSVNDAQNARVVRRLADALGGLAGRRIALWGLTYKVGTSTLRRSPALAIAALLADAEATLVAYDPMADAAELAAVAPTASLTRAADPYEAATGADAALLITPWPELLDLDLVRLHGVMARAVIADPQNMLDGARIADAGFTYLGAGRTVGGAGA